MEEALTPNHRGLMIGNHCKVRMIVEDRLGLKLPVNSYVADPVEIWPQVFPNSQLFVVKVPAQDWEDDESYDIAMDTHDDHYAVIFRHVEDMVEFQMKYL